MAGRTLSRSDLVEAVHRHVGLPKNVAGELVEAALEEIAMAAERGENIKLSSFGTFQVRDKGERIGRNPKTGEEVVIEPRRVLVFKPSHILREHVRDAPLEP
jgi:integration host factor subunit alpha